MVGEELQRALQRSARTMGIMRRVGSLITKAAALADGTGDVDEALGNVEDALAAAEALVDARIKRKANEPARN